LGSLACKVYIPVIVVIHTKESSDVAAATVPLPLTTTIDNRFTLSTCLIGLPDNHHLIFPIGQPVTEHHLFSPT